MKSLMIASAVLVCASQAQADSQCISLTGSVLANACDQCSDVTTYELKAQADPNAAHFTGLSHSVRLEGKTTQTLPGQGRWAIGEFKACR